MKYISLIVICFLTSGLFAQENRGTSSGKLFEQAKKGEVEKAVSDQKAVPANAEKTNEDTEEERDGLDLELDANKYQDFENARFKSYDSEALKSAYELSPNKMDLMDEMMGDAEIRGDKSSKKYFASEIKKSGKYSAYKYEYAKNLLNSIDQNGFLICNGEVDTYPLYVLQELQGVRKDVKIINLKLVENSAYWKRMSATYGLKGEYASSYIQFVSNLMQKNPDKKLYLSLTNRHDVLKHFKANLYLTGLAFQLSRTAMQNQNILQNNWNKFDLTFFKSKNKMNQDKKLDYSYMLILKSLYDFHSSSNKRLANDYKVTAENVAKNNGVWNKLESKFK